MALGCVCVCKLEPAELINAVDLLASAVSATAASTLIAHKRRCSVWGESHRKNVPPESLRRAAVAPAIDTCSVGTANGLCIEICRQTRFALQNLQHPRLACCSTAS
jgi:hypothetical protein